MMETFGYIVGIAATSIALMASGAWAIHSLASGLERLREKHTNTRWKAELSQLDQWLCNDFPIVEDMTRWLIGQDGRSIDSFREAMRKKYLRRE